jgi:taurine--2-oxoglutarate transaminase
MTTGEHTRDEILDLSRETTLYEWIAQKAMKPLVIERAEGIDMWDANGKRYMDFNSQLMCTNIGHGDARVNDAIKAQLDQVAYVAPTVATTAVRAELGRLLREISPGNLSKAFFTNGGAEANENAIKIARMYTGRSKILARYRAYHGATAGAISLTGDPRRWAAEPGIPGVVRIPDFYPYRAGYDADDPRYADQVLSATEEIIQFEGPHTIAAMLIETVVGTNGILIPSER